MCYITDRQNYVFLLQHYLMIDIHYGIVGMSLDC